MITMLVYYISNFVQKSIIYYYFMITWLTILFLFEQFWKFCRPKRYYIVFKKRVFIYNKILFHQMDYASGPKRMEWNLFYDPNAQMSFWKTTSFVLEINMFSDSHFLLYRNPAVFSGSEIHNLSELHLLIYFIDLWVDEISSTHRK